MRSTPAFAAAFGLAFSTITAQDAPPLPVVKTPLGNSTVLHRPDAAAETRWTMWVDYPDAKGAFLDHSLYLADLQRRFGMKGVRIAVTMPKAEAEAVAHKKPAFVVAVAAETRPVVHVEVAEYVPTEALRAFLCEGETLMRSVTSLDGVVDWLDACADGRSDGLANQEAEELLDAMMFNVGDAAIPAGQVAPMVTMKPRSGRARALAVLEQWWCRGDYDAAQNAIDAGLAALGGESVPMCVFADLVLRGDRIDRSVAKRLAGELGPVAAAAPDGPFTQLVYLRALLRAGQDRLAGRLVARLQKQLEGRPLDQLVFAETLMEAGTPGAFRDLADKCTAAAVAAGADRRWSYAARHKVLVRCGEPEAAEKLMIEYRGGDSTGSLNNDAWYMIVRPDSMGRFDTLALAQCEEMQRQEGARMDFGSKDTVALALFVNGKLQEAVDLQTEATDASQQNPPYVARLTRFTAALASQKKQAEKPPR